MNAPFPSPDSRPAVPAGREHADMLLRASLACRFFGRVFQEAPDDGLLQALKEQALFAAWPLPGRDRDAREGLRLLRSSLEGEAGAAVREDFTALFIGPEDPLLQWESTWTTKERLLFGEPTGAVRAFYARHGLEASGPEPEDHVALEFAFLGDLLERAEAAGEGGDARAAADLLAEAGAFYAEHLAQWAGAFLQELERRAATAFYRGAALLCRASLGALDTVLAPCPPGHGPGPA